MSMEQIAQSVGRDIAKVLDENKVAPPLGMKAWAEIHKIILDGLREARSTVSE